MHVFEFRHYGQPDNGLHAIQMELWGNALTCSKAIHGIMTMGRREPLDQNRNEFLQILSNS